MRGRDIKKIVDDYYQVDTLVKSMKRKYARPRQLVHYLCRKYTFLTTQQIANLTNINCHTTILFSVRSINKLSYKYPEFADEIREVEGIIESKLKKDVDRG